MVCMWFVCGNFDVFPYDYVQFMNPRTSDEHLNGLYIQCLISDQVGLSFSCCIRGLPIRLDTI